MRCTSVLRRIDDHVDGVLPAPVAEQIRDHLDACEDCREIAEATRLATSSLAEWDQGDAPSDACFESILRRVDSLPPDAFGRRPVSPWSRWLGPAGLAAAAAVLAAALIAHRDVADRDTQRTDPFRAETMAARVTGPRPGEEFVHVTDRRLDDGVRRRGANPRKDPAPVVPVRFDPGFGGPR